MVRCAGDSPSKFLSCHEPRACEYAHEHEHACLDTSSMHVWIFKHTYAHEHEHTF